MLSAGKSAGERPTQESEIPHEDNKICNVAMLFDNRITIQLSIL
jgi:hypothetical protein